MPVILDFFGLNQKPFYRQILIGLFPANMDWPVSRAIHWTGVIIFFVGQILVEVLITEYLLRLPIARLSGQLFGLE